MFMTVLKIDFDSLQNRSYLMKIDDGDFMHRWLTSQMNCERVDQHILYRIDKFTDSIYIYIQSDSAFNLKNVQKSGMHVVKQFEINCTGDKIAFAVRCFPTHRVGDKRLYILDATERENYIKRVLSRYIDVETIGEIRSARYFVKGNKSLTFCDFSGTGTIKNYADFMNVVRHGIGKCKCYGAGMLLFKGVN